MTKPPVLHTKHRSVGPRKGVGNGFRLDTTVGPPGRSRRRTRFTKGLTNVDYVGGATLGDVLSGALPLPNKRSPSRKDSTS